MSRRDRRLRTAFGGVNVVNGVLDRRNLFGLIIGNLGFELFL